MKFNIQKIDKEVRVAFIGENGQTIGWAMLDYAEACALIDDLNDAAYEIFKEKRQHR